MKHATQHCQLSEQHVAIGVCMFKAPRAAEAGCVTDAEAAFQIVEFVFACFAQRSRLEVARTGQWERCCQTSITCFIVGPVAGVGTGGDVAIDAIKEFGAVYLMAVGGAAYLVSKAIKSSRVVAFEELGMEAIYEFEIEDMPVTVAVDSQGVSVHRTGPQQWQQVIALQTP